MEPIVLVGGGEYHYRVIQSLTNKQMAERPVVLVAQNIKVFPSDFLAPALLQKISVADAQLDLWTACQRKGVYFLEDTCLSIAKEDQVLQLRKFGNLKYHSLSVETQTQPTLLGREPIPAVTTINPGNPYVFLDSMESFFAEVHKHCPREVRVILSGFNKMSAQLAVAIKARLSGGAESSDIIILQDEVLEKNRFLKTSKERKQEALKNAGVRMVYGAMVDKNRDHLLQLVDGTTLSYDVLIPCSHFRSSDFLGKIFQGDSQTIFVSRELQGLGQIFLTGDNVQFETESLKVRALEGSEVASVLRQNLFRENADTPLLSCRDKKKVDSLKVTKNWWSYQESDLKNLKKIEVLETSRHQLHEALSFQAQHMSRPWQGLVISGSNEGARSFRLNSFNGFNSWGSFALSAIKITETAILKSLSRGVKPKQLRFSLTLPAERDHLLNHIFESTFRAIEGVADKHGIEIDGGDTFDGKHWHLNVTMGGEVVSDKQEKFQPHDYVLMTRPLGFGFLWAGRLSDRFDSTWIQKTINEPLVSDMEQLLAFTDKWGMSAPVLIEEWGFLYHCLQKLPAHQQLMVNFREVPRWEGVDPLIGEKVSHPGLDINWTRIQSDVAFQKDDVSLTNAILWDSLSQGSLVFSVRPEHWREALQDLRQIGYSHAALVGCIRPKVKGSRVILSDWSPN